MSKLLSSKLGWHKPNSNCIQKLFFEDDLTINVIDLDLNYSGIIIDIYGSLMRDFKIFFWALPHPIFICDEVEECKNYLDNLIEKYNNLIIFQ